MTTAPNEVRRPAWREPMVWLVAAIPAMSIFAGVGLLVVAIRAGGADSVSDPVRRTAQVQVADLSPDALAASLHLRAVVRTDAGGVEVIPVDGDFDRNISLKLTLKHPIEARADRSMELQPTATGWHAGATVEIDHDWVLDLSPADDRWRLQGRWPARQQATVLLPAVDAPQ